MEQHADNPEENIELDIKFHRRIANATNNPIIPIIMEPIFQLLHKFISATYRQSHAPDLAIKYHHEIVECLKNKDCEGASKTMYQHLEDAEKHVIAYYESTGFTDY
jgi:GntR family transcriptional repressor for pyruvate dehydrogenase complex